MNRKIIIPTDFSIESLNILKPVLNEYSGEEKLDIIFIHGYQTGDGIRDLLFISRSRIISNLCTLEFDEALDIIRNKYTDRIARIRKELFTGFTQAAFNSFIEGLGGKEAFLPARYKYRLPHKRSFELSRYMEKCTLLNKHKVQWNTEDSTPEKGIMAELFLSTSTILN